MSDNADATANVGDGTQGTGSADAQSSADLPKWAQEQLTKARNDAASYRTRLRETETARDGLKTNLDAEVSAKAALELEVKDLKSYNDKFGVALDAHDVDRKKIETFADRLRGATTDELVTDAKSLLETFGVAPSGTKGRAPDRSAGLGNEKPPTPEDAWSSFVGDKLGWGQ